VVIHGQTAYWVEVAANPQLDSRGQIEQVLQQINETLAQIGSDRSHLLQVTIFLADLADITLLNELWDSWVPQGHAPVRACMQAGLGSGCRIEVLITAAVRNQD
jgi:enamine deaminase RidA (YjgF/YER057c/UK114 family)